MSYLLSLGSLFSLFVKLINLLLSIDLFIRDLKAEESMIKGDEGYTILD
jgi:hypothetical protein